MVISSTDRLADAVGPATHVKGPKRTSILAQDSESLYLQPDQHDGNRDNSGLGKMTTPRRFYPSTAVTQAFWPGDDKVADAARTADPTGQPWPTVPGRVGSSDVSAATVANPRPLAGLVNKFYRSSDLGPTSSRPARSVLPGRNGSSRRLISILLEESLPNPTRTRNTVSAEHPLQTARPPLWRPRADLQDPSARPVLLAPRRRGHAGQSWRFRASCASR